MLRIPIILVAAALLVQSSAAVVPDDPKIAEAVRAGANYLRQAAGPRGHAGSHGVGEGILAGLAMLEGGIKADDPVILNLVADLRKNWSGETNTYAISLAILFLDRFGDAADVPIVQLLGTRLYSGQTAEGGWTYTCPDLEPMIRLDQSNEMLGTPGGLGQGKPPPDKPKKDDGFPTVGGKASPFAPVSGGKLPRGIAAYNALVRSALAARGRQSGGDNSNTQFGLIAMWAASRHGVPADDAFTLLEARFLRTQNAADAGWGYNIAASSTPAMTCAGLLGLAVGAGRGDAGFNSAAPPAAPPGSKDPFDNPKKTEPGFRPGPANPLAPAGPAQRKAAVDAALKSLGGVLHELGHGRLVAFDDQVEGRASGAGGTGPAEVGGRGPDEAAQRRPRQGAPRAAVAAGDDDDAGVDRPATPDGRVDVRVESAAGQTAGEQKC